MTWAGAVVLILAAGFFAKFAFDQGWLDPRIRTISGLVFGVILVAAGERFIRRGMRPLGQGLVGAGLAIMYISIYAASAYFGLITTGVAFRGMIIVTAGGMALAVWRDAMPISILALLGGFLTPAILSTGVNQRDALFAYLLVLDLGALAAAFFRRWRALDVLSFAATFAFYGAWYDEFYDVPQMLPAMFWLSGFYLLFLVLPFVYDIPRRAPIRVERFVIAVVNAFAYFGFAYAMLHVAQRPALAVIAVDMALFYFVGAALVRGRIAGDDKSVFAFTALAVSCLATAAPLYYGIYGTSVAWAVEAPLILFLGYRFDYRPARVMAALALALAFGNVLLREWPDHREPFRIFANARFAAAFSVSLGAFAFALVAHLHRKVAADFDAVLKVSAAIAGSFLGLFLIHAETAVWFRFAGNPAASATAPVFVWALGAAVLFLAGLRASSLPVRLSAFVALLPAIALAFVSYHATAGVPMLAFANPRFAATLAVSGVVFILGGLLWARRERASRAETSLARVAIAAAIALLLTFVSFEAGRFAMSVPFAGLDPGWLSGLCASAIWSVGSLLFLFAGLRMHSAPMRLLTMAGIALGVAFAFSLYDRTPAGYRVILNLRFAVCLLACISAFVSGWTLWVLRKRCAPLETGVSRVAVGVAIVLLLTFLTVEFAAFSGTLKAPSVPHEWFTRLCFAAIWSLGSLLFLAAGIRMASPSLRLLSLIFWVPAAAAAASIYNESLHDYRIILNARFAAAFAAPLAVFICAAVSSRYRAKGDQSDSVRARIAVVCGIASLLAVLSLEAYTWFPTAFGDNDRARSMSQMALTVTWAGYAAALLAIGFWRRIRPLRFAALFLFSATAVKLLLVDVANVRQVYRILAFFVTGLLMIAAAYLYHRLEKLLDPRRPTGAPDENHT